MQEKDKQVEEMRKDVASIHRFFFEDDDYEVLDDYIADMLFARGYRKVDDIFEDIFEGRLEVVNKRSGDKLKKASDVAEEIFAEMREELVRYLMLNENIAIKCKEENGELNAEYWKGKLSAFKQIQGFIDAELKKKYTVTDTNVGCKESENDNGKM